MGRVHGRVVDVAGDEAALAVLVLAALELFLRSDMRAKLAFLADADAAPGWSGKVFRQSAAVRVRVRGLPTLGALAGLVKAQ